MSGKKSIPKEYKPDKNGLITRLPDTQERTNASVKLFPVKNFGWYIKAESTQCGQQMIARMCLSRMAMEALVSMWVKLEVKRGDK
jgi:hypothetical protein